MISELTLPTYSPTRELHLSQFVFLWFLKDNFLAFFCNKMTDSCKGSCGRTVMLYRVISRTFRLEEIVRRTQVTIVEFELIIICVPIRFSALPWPLFEHRLLESSYHWPYYDEAMSMVILHILFVCMTMKIVYTSEGIHFRIHTEVTLRVTRPYWNQLKKKQIYGI